MKTTSIYGPCARKPYILFFSKEPTITRSVQWDGRSWTLYQVTQSCQLTVEGQAPHGMVCLCGGGGAGIMGVRNGNGGNGGGGGYLESYYDVEIVSGPFVIGAGGTYSSAAGGKTTYGGHSVLGSGATGHGGTGGGSGGRGGSGPGGDKKTKHPFGVSSLYAHCGGGGGGGFYYDRTITSDNRSGGNGGSQGSNGLAHSSGSSLSANGGAGGMRGGGNGGMGQFSADATGMAKVDRGQPATFYGSGGGGGAAGHSDYAVGGYGYQGVAYIMLEE